MTTISNFISSINFGNLQTFENMSVLPLLSDFKSTTQYLTLKEALDKDILKICEINSSGSVPELSVINEGVLPVLLLDGEEVVGAKQNRVLNTTILLKQKSKTIIPVSCTEQGRWDYRSENFVDSDEVLDYKIRSSKMASVSNNLCFMGDYASDQLQVWEGIQDKFQRSNERSNTSAMKDIFDNKRTNLNEYLKVFNNTDNQKGIMVIVNGQAVGFDIVSSKNSYKQYHEKIVRSYAMEAMLDKKSHQFDNAQELTKSFFKKAIDCSENKYKSIGHGWDHRFHGREMVGSSLIYNSEPIHTAFFKTDSLSDSDNMAGIRNRMRYRGGLS